MEEKPSDAAPFPSQPPPPPRRVSLPLPSSSPSPRRLSSQFIHPTRPLRSSRQLAWVDVQERNVKKDGLNRGIGGGLALGWEMFSPVQRVLVVAVIAVASVNSEKNKRILKLMKSVEMRDQVLQSMQEKLDSLCEQLNSIKDQPGAWADMSIDKNVDLVFKDPIAVPKLKSFGCGCQFCDHHKVNSYDSLDNSLLKDVSGDEVLKRRYSLYNAAEADERRMSNLSDWNSSIASSVDIQMNSMAIEQDVDNLKKECEEKDATIKELSTFLHSSNISYSKRIAELEDIIRTKNTRITRLKKDMLVLEQKVVQLTRLRRQSNTTMKQKPAMANNILFDMESTTSHSSSDSDCPPKNLPQNPVVKTRNGFVSKNSSSKLGQEAKKDLNLMTKPIAKNQQKARPVSPLKEKSLNQKTDSVSFSSKKRVQSAKKLIGSHQRWV